MRRMICGAILFLCLAAGHVSRLLACEDRPGSRFYASVFESDGNTVLITSDGDVVTVVVYSNAGVAAEWM